MGQKLVGIKFNAGSSSDLWNPNLSPDLQVRVSGSNGWQDQDSYYPDLAKGNSLPVEIGNSQPLTTALLQSLIQNNQTAAFLVDDSVEKWQISLKEDFLTEGNWTVLASGSFN